MFKLSSTMSSNSLESGIEEAGENSGAAGKPHSHAVVAVCTNVLFLAWNLDETVPYVQQQEFGRQEGPMTSSPIQERRNSFGGQTSSNLSNLSQSLSKSAAFDHFCFVFLSHALYII